MLAALGCVLFAALSHAQTPAAGESYVVELKVIEATPPGAGAKPGQTTLDPALQPLANDLKALPFQEFRLADTMVKELRAGEAFTMQFGNPERKRFIRVSAVDKREGKVKLNVTMEDMRKKKPKVELKSDVSIPEGATLVLAPPRKGKSNEPAILLAVSARTQVAPKPAAGSDAAVVPPPGAAPHAR
ncbi:MAG: hypothetical protein AB2A00_36940 [Myxococcota bacterium]